MARLRIAAAVVALGIAGLPAEAWAQKKNPSGEAVLLLTGGQREHHGYRDQALFLASLLEDTGKVRVTICEDAAILETPALAKYKTLIVNADRRDPEFRLTEGQQKAILRFVEDGHGYVSIHGADNAAADWLPEMKTMLGGWFSHKGLPDGKVRKGNYEVKVADKTHPITAGIPDFPLRDELYYHLQMASNVEPLITAEHEGTAWPLAWAKTYGKGRVFHTVLGHRDFGPDKDDPLRNPNLSQIVARGVLWTVGQESK